VGDDSEETTLDGDDAVSDKLRNIKSDVLDSSGEFVSELGLGETVLLSFNYSEYRDRFQVTDLVHGGVVNTSATPLYGGEPTGTGYLQPFGGDPEATNGTFTVAFTGSQAFQQKIRIEAFVRAHPSSLELSVTHPFVSQHHSSHTHTHTDTHTHTRTFPPSPRAEEKEGELRATNGRRLPTALVPSGIHPRACLTE
jgi:hypothetical protein